MRRRAELMTSVTLALLPLDASAAEVQANLTGTTPAIIALAVFVVAYVCVIAEEITELRKSIPVVLAAGIVWMLVAAAWLGQADTTRVTQALRENLLEFGELLLFLLAA